MLTDIQLKMIDELVSFLPPEYGEPAVFARSLIYDELRRRTHGPLTLAEAVASGYIKRAGWDDGEFYTGIYTGHGAITCFERAGSNSNSDRIFEAEDALASDYEPKPIDKPEEI